MLYNRDNHTSKYYFGSVDDLGDSHLKELRRVISLFNQRKYFDKPKRVIVRGRKPLNKINGRSYTYGGNVVGGLSNASVFDVYVVNR